MSKYGIQSAMTLISCNSIDKWNALWYKKLLGKRDFTNRVAYFVLYPFLDLAILLIDSSYFLFLACVC